MERITHQARVAKEIKVDNAHNKIKIVFHGVEDLKSGGGYPTDKLPLENGQWSLIYGMDFENGYSMFMDRDVWETQFFFAYQKDGRNSLNLYAERQENSYTSPITGENYFGDTELISLQFSELNENVLRIELVMKSLETNHTIKIATAVFMPSCERKEGLPHE